MANQFIGHIDALVRGAEIILTNSRGSIGGKYVMGKDYRNGYPYLSFYPSKTGNIEILGGKVNSRFRLSCDCLEHLGFSGKDEAIIIGNDAYFELWKLSNLEDLIKSRPFTEEDAISLSQAEQNLSLN